MEIPKEISIVRDIANKEVRFFCDPGRVQRPLFIVKNSEIELKKHHIQKLESRRDDSMNFDDSLKQGLIEFVDVEEEETTMIAMHISYIKKKCAKYAYTHCEIHPSIILGFCVLIIPFPDHNQVSLYFRRVFTIFFEFYSHQETLIKVQWANKLWVFIPATTF